MKLHLNIEINELGQIIGSKSRFETDSLTPINVKLIGMSDVKPGWNAFNYNDVVLSQHAKCIAVIISPKLEESI